MRFPNPFLSAPRLNEVPAVDSSGGGDADAGEADVSGDVPPLDEGEGQGEGEGEARDDGRDPKGRFKPKAGEAAKPPPPAKRKFALKTKDGVVEEELSDEEVTQRLTRDRESYKRFEQAAADRKAAAEERKAAAATQAKLNALMDDPKALRAYLREHRGEKAHDLMVHALREELAERARERSLDPRDVELERLRAEKQEREAREAEEEESRHEREAQEAIQQQAERLRPEMEKKVWGALEKVGLPGDERLARVMAYHYLTNKQEGIELSMDELAKVASDELDRDLGVRTQGLTGAQVKQRYPHLYRAVHADLVAQLKGRQGGGNVVASAGADPLREAPAPRPAGAKKALTPAEWRNL